MFIAINLDLGSNESDKDVRKVINEYGIKKINENLYESFEFPAKKIGNLKKDLTICMDMDDKVRLYQYPLENSFKISYIENKKWKRLSVNAT